MKEVLISIIGAIGLGGLITFFIKRHDDKKEKYKTNLIEILKVTCSYSQLITDNLARLISLNKRKVQQMDDPLQVLTQMVDEQKRDERKLKKIHKQCSNSNIRNCDECNRLMNLWYKRKVNIDQDFSQIRADLKENNHELQQKINDARDSIKEYNGLLNLVAVSSIKHSRIHVLLSELDIKTMNIILFEEKKKPPYDFYYLLTDQLELINKIRVLINRQLT